MCLVVLGQNSCGQNGGGHNRGGQNSLWTKWLVDRIAGGQNSFRTK